MPPRVLASGPKPCLHGQKFKAITQVPKFLETQSHIELPISYSQSTHIQALQSQAANPAIHRHPNLTQVTVVLW